MTLPGTLQIQTVFYKATRSDVDRFLSSVARAAEVAKASGHISAATLVAGDCSPLPIFRAAGLPELTDSLLRAGLDGFEYEFFDCNLGSAGGHNSLLEKSTSDLIWIVNPDIVASPNVIQELVLRLDDSKIGMIEGRQIPIEHPKAYDQSSGETSWASTACALLPRNVVQEIGHFDSESFFLYCDDVDYSWRVRLAGYKVLFHPPARIFHDKRLDLSGRMVVSAAEVYYAAEAALLMAHKWSRPDLVETFLTWMLSDGEPLQRKAAEAFLERQKNGKLPEPLDPDHRIGEFHEGNWAVHRW